MFSPEFPSNLKPQALYGKLKLFIKGEYNNCDLCWNSPADAQSPAMGEGSLPNHTELAATGQV